VNLNGRLSGIMSWRIFWMTDAEQSAEAMPQRFALHEHALEIELLDRLLDRQKDK